MKKRMCLLKLISYLIIVSSVIFSCSNKANNEKIKSDYEYIKDYFETKHNFDISEEIKMVIIITQNGCPGCNKSFVYFTISNLNLKNSVILVTSDGKGLDISNLRNLDGNVFFDDEICSGDERELFSNSSVIFIEENAIDSIVNIEAQTINNQFTEILSK
ncbi:MAG: hypothetical protein PHH30_07665 [Bacteroidales bacterium]|nr:hypothetical protein [Bacteroidales bacterium]